MKQQLQEQCVWSRRRFILGGLLCAGLPALGIAQSGGFRTTPGQYNSSLTLALSGLRVTQAGQVTRSVQGDLRRGYHIEGEASSAAADGSTIVRRLAITADVFTPAVDMPGQKKGRAYLRGLWTLETEPGAVPAGIDDFEGKLAGRIKAELPKDPVAGLAAIDGSLDVPMGRLYQDASRASFRPVRGTGSVAFRQDATGQMALSLNLWPLFESTSPNT